jgi:hypothetical protein
MSNTKHTPGPWTQYRDSRGNVRIQGNVQGGPVAFIEEMNNTGGTEQDHANARLIAAAPDLLAACQEIIDGMVDGKNSTNKNVTMYAIQMVKSAIAKATGTNA